MGPQTVPETWFLGRFRPNLFARVVERVQKVKKTTLYIRYRRGDRTFFSSEPRNARKWPFFTQFQARSGLEAVDGARIRPNFFRQRRPMCPVYEENAGTHSMPARYRSRSLNFARKWRFSPFCTRFQVQNGVLPGRFRPNLSDRVGECVE